MEILFENENFVACVKDVGLSSEEDMVRLLKDITKSEIYTVHRLDTAVGGVMVYAKNKKWAAYLSSLIEKRELKKTYLAICEGVFSEKEGEMNDLLFKDSKRNKSFVVSRERKGVKKARLSYTVANETSANGKNFSLAVVTLDTGRSHQIRVQFSSRKHPLVGDGKYGSKTNCSIALFSHKIAFGDYEFSAYPDGNTMPWSLFPDR